MVQRDTGNLVRLVILRYAAGDVDKLQEVWHEDIEVTTFLSSGVARGREALAQYTRRLMDEDRVHLAPESVRIAGANALIDGSIVFDDDRPPVPITWLWTFEDGLLWRSVTFEGQAEHAGAVTHAHARQT